MKPNFFAISLTIIFGIIASATQAQYFGRNKPQYQSFDFEILKTPHFSIYHYLDNDSLINNIGLQSEKWYKRHQLVLADTFKNKNPLILYNNHADFQQTDVVSSQISVGTGGVTEGLRNRVVMPFLQTYRQTDHVLGHELVHAFQYHMLIHRDSTSLNSIRNLPLWMVEGLAEYLSIGRVDPHTAMWMRDAVISEDVPTLRQMTVNQRYFPYRYGQAFWAFTTGVYGDSIIDPLFTASAKVGYDLALQRMFKVNEKTFSNIWKNSLIEAYKPFMEDTIAAVGDRLFSAANAGEMNLTPVYSPDGRYLAFLSEKDVLSIDLYLADAQTGEIIRKLSRATQRFHIDDFSYIETAGTFSPDGNKFAYVAFSKGKNTLIVTETVKGKLLEEIEINELPSFSDPAWSPDGRYIALSGLKNGQTDLYLYDYVNHELVQLTDDLYSEIQPSWSADSKKIVFASDRGDDTNLENLEFGSFKISIFDLETGEVSALDFFPGADNMNPKFSPDGYTIFFLSNADGFRNLYEYKILSGEINKLTKYFTGISGITEYSPAITLNQTNGDIAYSLYRDGKYSIYSANSAEFPRFPADPYEVDFTAATLPPFETSPRAFQQDPPERTVQTAPKDSFEVDNYNAKLGLTYISNNGGFGVGTSRMGTGFAGGVNMLFTDMLNNHQLYAGLSLNGEIYDFGGQVVYLNRKSTVSWGAGVSHIPYLTGYYASGNETLVIDGDSVVVPTFSTILRRIFEDQISLFAHLPFSQTLRLEAGGSVSRYSFREDEYKTYYSPNGFPIGSDREKLPTEEGFNIARTYLAYVGDNSRFGVTAPLTGQRYRLEVEKLFGEIDYYGVLADFRKYYFTNPISFAFRGLHYARYGAGADSRLISPLVIGSDYLVRGYNINSFTGSARCAEGDCLSFDQLIGTRMAVVNAEIRIPFTGPKRLAIFPSNLLYSDLAFFADAGLVWESGQDVEFRWDPVAGVQSPIVSAGVALRVNLFNMAIIEPYYAFPFQREDGGRGVFGLTLTSGGW